MTDPKVVAAYDKIRIDANSAVRIWKNVLAIQSAFEAAMNGKPFEQPAPAAEERRVPIEREEPVMPPVTVLPAESEEPEETGEESIPEETAPEVTEEEAVSEAAPEEPEYTEPEAEEDVRVYEVPVKKESREEFDWSELEAETAALDEESEADEELPEIEEDGEEEEDEEYYEPSHARHEGHRKKHSRHRSTLASVLIGAVIMIVASVALFLIFRSKIDGGKPEDTASVQSNTAISVAVETPNHVSFEGAKEDVGKLENVQKAMQEWNEYKKTTQRAYLEEHLPSFVDFIPNDEYFDGTDIVENGDDTVSLIHWLYVEDWGNTTISPVTGQEEPALIQKFDYEHSVTVEQDEYSVYVNYMIAKAASEGYGDYNYSYGVENAADAQKLEEIAAKYNLTLRKGDGTTCGYGEGTNDELLSELAAKVGHGKIYAGTPEIDYFTYYDNGAFEAMAEIRLDDGRRMYTLICSAPYSEMVDLITANGITIQGDEMSTRSYKSADGTELTIAQNDTQAVIYAYTDSSYIVVDMSINSWRDSPLYTDTEEQRSEKQETDFEISDEAVNFVADTIQFSNIGK